MPANSFCWVVHNSSVSELLSFPSAFLITTFSDLKIKLSLQGMASSATCLFDILILLFETELSSYSQNSLKDKVIQYDFLI